VGRIPRRRLVADRLLGAGIRTGGVIVIGLVLAILIFLLAEAWPLTGSGRVREGFALPLESAPATLASDDYLTHVALLGSEGELRVIRAEDGETVVRRTLLAEGDGAGVHRVLRHPAPDFFAASTTDGRALVVPVGWRISFEGADRVVTPAVGDVSSLVLDPEGRPLRLAAASRDDERTTAVAQTQGGELVRVRRIVDVNEFTGERSESVERDVLPARPDLERILLDPAQRTLYGATRDGTLLWWDLTETPVGPPRLAGGDRRPVTAMTLLTGGRSLVVGRADGTVEVWFRVRHSPLSERLTRVRSLPPRPEAIAQLAPAFRDRSFLAVDAAGGASVYFSTSDRELWSGEAPVEPVRAAAVAPKGDALLFASGERLVEKVFDAPHPEASFSAYFQKIWYEGFAEPRHTWQSTGGTDEFESKLGIVPLLFGTLKGTVYSLLLAVPLAILGAIYTSQFMHPTLQRYVKPTVEMMASLPTVVLGFVGGLWLAPRLETAFPAFLCMLVFLPLALVVTGLVWLRRPRFLRARVPDGGEIALFAVTLSLALWASFEAGPYLSQWLFAGDFNGWLYRETGLRVDQRNAIVVGIAMGFAVIPIIFSIADDALSSVPRTLSSGSLALGANRWETVVRVVLPTASPGIFSAVMIGLGRAVGETMIVLMATGNTPIMDWSPFNGFRTLAANIAVEIPEAPYGGTLYRTLFLTALLLFALTFFFNTVAEVVRQRLRRRYGHL